MTSGTISDSVESTSDESGGGFGVDSELGGMVVSSGFDTIISSS